MCIKVKLQTRENISKTLDDIFANKCSSKSRSSNRNTNTRVLTLSIACSYNKYINVCIRYRPKNTDLTAAQAKYCKSGTRSPLRNQCACVKIYMWTGLCALCALRVIDRWHKDLVIKIHPTCFCGIASGRFGDKSFSKYPTSFSR